MQDVDHRFYGKNNLNIFVIDGGAEFVAVGNEGNAGTYATSHGDLVIGDTLEVKTNAYFATINVSGGANLTATNATHLGSQLPAYYLNAANHTGDMAVAVQQSIDLANPTGTLDIASATGALASVSIKSILLAGEVQNPTNASPYNLIWGAKMPGAATAVSVEYGTAAGTAVFDVVKRTYTDSHSTTTNLNVGLSASTSMTQDTSWAISDLAEDQVIGIIITNVSSCTGLWINVEGIITQ